MTVPRAYLSRLPQVVDNGWDTPPEIDDAQPRCGEVDQAAVVPYLSGSFAGVIATTAGTREP